MFQSKLYIMALFGLTLGLGADSLYAKKTQRSHIPKLKVGVCLPLSGGLRSYGEAFKRGVEFSHERLKTQDKKLYQAIDYRFIDCSHSNIKNIKNKVADLHLVVGGLTRATQKSIVDLTANHKFAYLSPLLSTKNIASLDKSRTIDLSNSNPEPLNILSAKALTSQNPYVFYSTGHKPQACKQISCSVLGNFSDLSSQKRIEDILDQLETVGPSREVYAFLSKPDFRLFFKFLNNKSFSLPVSVPTFYASLLSTNINLQIDYYASFSNLDPKGSIFAHDFFKKYRKQPNTINLLGFEIASFIAEVTRATSTQQAKSIVHAASLTPFFEGPQGKITKTTDNDWQRSFSRLRWQKGHTQFLENFLYSPHQ